jgi:hypothetical protein
LLTRSETFSVSPDQLFQSGREGAAAAAAAETVGQQPRDPSGIDVEKLHFARKLFAYIFMLKILTNFHPKKLQM